MVDHPAGDPRRDPRVRDEPNRAIPPGRQGPWIPTIRPSEPGPRFEVTVTQEGVAGVLNSAGNIVSVEGVRVGRIDHIFIDQAGGQPLWVSIGEGQSGLAGSLVPLIGAHVEGNDLVVAFSKDIIKDSPQIDAHDQLVLKQENELVKYYESDILGVATGNPFIHEALGPDDVVAEAVTEQDLADRTGDDSVDDAGR